VKREGQVNIRGIKDW